MEQIRARVPICLELKYHERVAGCQCGLPDELLHTALRVDVLLSQRLQCGKEGMGGSVSVRLLGLAWRQESGEGRVWCECGESAAAWLGLGLGCGLAWHVPAGEAIPPGLCCAALLPGA